METSDQLGEEGKNFSEPLAAYLGGACLGLDQDPEEFAKRLEPLVTPEMENVAALEPSLKSWALREGAAARGLPLKRRDVSAAEVFFTGNPLWTAGHLLHLLEHCGKLGKPGTTYDPLWHAKMGAEFKFLVRNLSKILQELQLERELPELRIVPPESLYKYRRPRKRRA